MRYIYCLRSPARARILQLSGTPKRILILRFSALGDIVQTLPIANWLRAQYPEATIGWAIDEELAPAIEGHPALDHIHRIPRKRWNRSLRNPAAWLSIRREFIDFINELKAVDYDLAVDPQSLFKTSFVAFCAGIKRRVGYGHGRELSGLFMTERHLTRQEYFDHDVLHMTHLAQLAQAVGCRETPLDVIAPSVPPEIAAKVSDMLRGGFRSVRKAVAIAPGTQWDSKLWPEAYWVELIEKILASTELNVALVGSKGDSPLCARIEKSLNADVARGRVCDISGKTNIREMYALYSQVIAAIGADSAPQHIAGAAKTPCVIAIFGPTGFKRTPPVGAPFTRLLSSQGTLDCQPCHKSKCKFATNECMRRVTPDMVLAALHEGIGVKQGGAVANARS
jgi:heptosyltransferase I